MPLTAQGHKRVLPHDGFTHSTQVSATHLRRSSTGETPLKLHISLPPCAFDLMIKLQTSLGHLLPVMVTIRGTKATMYTCQQIVVTCSLHVSSMLAAGSCTVPLLLLLLLLWRWSAAKDAALHAQLLQ